MCEAGLCELFVNGPATSNQCPAHTRTHLHARCEPFPLRFSPTHAHPFTPPLSHPTPQTPDPDNKRSLELDYAHWAEFQPTLSIWLADAPKQMMEYLDEAATEVVEKVRGAWGLGGGAWVGGGVGESVEVEVGG